MDGLQENDGQSPTDDVVEVVTEIPCWLYSLPALRSSQLHSSGEQSNSWCSSEGTVR
jgi:hypothetical protein